MPSHLSSIGLPVSDQSEFISLVDRIGPMAISIEVPNGVYWKLTSDCGAELWLQANIDNEIIGATPCFAGRGRITVRLNARILRSKDTPLEGAFHGWAAPDENDLESGAFPFVFDAVDSGRYSTLELPTVVEAQIAAFAHELSVFPTPDAYSDSQTGEIKFASQSFIPSGLFSSGGESTDPPGSMAIFTGHVLATERKVNTFTGSEYYWALVDTLGGSFDVVFDAEVCDISPVVGGVISGSFWLCGRLIQ